MNIIDFLLGRKMAGNNVPDDWTFTNCEGLFYNGARMELLNELMSRVQGITNAARMFYGVNCREPNLLDQLPSGFLNDLRECVNCEEMFYQSNGFTEFPDFSFSVPTNLREMFNHNSILQTVGSISAPDIVIPAGYGDYYVDSLFNYCTRLVSFGGLTIHGDKAAYATNMFYNCKSLTHIGPLNFKIRGFSSAFYSCVKLERIPTLFLFNPDGNVPGGFPNGRSATDRAALKSLTFHPDSSCKGISNFKLNYCSFERDGMLALFNSLPDITGSTLPSSSKTITITGNPCVTGKLPDGTACATLTSADKAIATNKGWSLVI